MKKFITKPVITEQGEIKLAFYRIIGRETPKGDMVDTIDYIGEASQEELQAQLFNLEQQKNEIEEKLSFY